MFAKNAFLPLLLAVGLIVASATGCANEPRVSVEPIPDVQYLDEDPPRCFDAEVTETPGEITCEWRCNGFWTPIYGVGLYHVKRTWVLGPSGWTFAPNNIEYEHFSTFCD